MSQRLAECLEVISPFENPDRANGTVRAQVADPSSDLTVRRGRKTQASKRIEFVRIVSGTDDNEVSAKPGHGGNDRLVEMLEPVIGPGPRWHGNVNDVVVGASIRAPARPRE